MIISIGLFAHNEAAVIEGMLRSLLLQDLLHGGAHADVTIEILCIPNGCTDSTAEIARETLQTAGALSTRGATVEWRVDELPVPSKANAWNYFVHQASRPDSEFLICLDSDIGLPQRDCLSRVVSCLASAADAHVAVDEPLKVIGRATRKLAPMSWLNKLITKQKQDVRRPGVNVIAGSLFCGRTSVLRRIWLPHGLVRAEDGFIKAMVITNRFTTPEEHHRLVCAKGSYHTFDAYNTAHSLFRHNRNQHVGVTVNAIVYDYLWKNATVYRDAGVLIRDHNEADPEWLLKLVKDRLTPELRRTTILEYVLWPTKRYRSRQSGRTLPGLGLAVLHSILRVPVALSADLYLRRMRFEW